jgi:uncharacterized repeat protein (TIGR04002 family)
MSSKNNRQFRLLIFTSLFAAIIFIATTYLKLPLPVMGYVHLGDSLIFIAATLLPCPYALTAAAIGAGLADVIGGFPQYALATLVLKALTAACFSARRGRSVCARNFTALLPAIIINAGGYYIFEALLYGSFVSPIANLPFNTMQSVSNGIIFILVGMIIDKTPGLSSLFDGIRPEKKTNKKEQD